MVSRQPCHCVHKMTYWGASGVKGGKVEGAANKKMEGIHDDEYGAEERETLTRKRGSKKTQFTKIDHELRSRMDNTSPGFFPLGETLILTRI